MSLLAIEELRDAGRRIGMVASHDGRTMRSVGQSTGLTASDALAWAAEIERMVAAKLGAPDIVQAASTLEYAIDCLAMSLGPMTVVRGSGAWQIRLEDDPQTEISGGYTGSTFREALIAALKSRFGEDLRAAAEPKIASMANDYASLRAHCGPVTE